MGAQKWMVHLVPKVSYFMVRPINQFPRSWNHPKWSSVLIRNFKNLFCCSCRCKFWNKYSQKIVRFLVPASSVKYGIIFHSRMPHSIQHRFSLPRHRSNPYPSVEAFINTPKSSRVITCSSLFTPVPHCRRSATF